MFAVKFVHLDNDEQLHSCSNREAESDDEDDCSNEIISCTCLSLPKCNKSNDNTTATSVGDANSHENGETELTRESDEENDVVEEGIVAECIVCRSEPANIGEGDEENAVKDGKTKSSWLLINTKDQSSSKEIGHQNNNVKNP